MDDELIARSEVTYEPRDQRLRLAEGKQVTARKLLNLQPQAVSRYLMLELVREEPVITARECGGRNVRPASERKGRLEQ